MTEPGPHTRCLDKIAGETGLPISVVRSIINSYVADVSRRLASGDEVCIPRLGVLHTVKQQLRNPHSCAYAKSDGSLVHKDVYTRLFVRFRRSRELGRYLRRRLLTRFERRVGHERSQG